MKSRQSAAYTKPATVMPESGECLIFDVHGLYIHSFKRVDVTSSMLTYRAPPITTIYGLISACMGLPRDDYNLLQRLAITVKPLNTPSMVDDYASNRSPTTLMRYNQPTPKSVMHWVAKKYGLDARIFQHDTVANINAKLTAEKLCETACKLKDECKNHYKTDEGPCSEIYNMTVWQASPSYVQRMYKPEYRCYIIGKPEDLKAIGTALKDPAISPGLGRADDMCTIDNVHMAHAMLKDSEYCTTMTEQRGNGAESVATMPVNFLEATDTHKARFKVCSMPSPNGRITFTSPTKCYEVEGDMVAFISPL